MTSLVSVHMPELPELEVVREVLQRRIVGQTITAVEIIPPGGPIVARDLTHAGFESALTGAILTALARRGKYLVFTLQAAIAPLFLVLNPKLTGRLQLASPAEKHKAKTWAIFTLSGGGQVRYLDQKQMGQLYLTQTLESIPDYVAMGPEALEISLEEFRQRLKPYRGEIKGVLTRGEFVAGIGNAYADEILWEAHLYPYRKRTQLTPQEVERLYQAMRSTLLASIEKVTGGNARTHRAQTARFPGCPHEDRPTLPTLRHANFAGRRQPAHHQFLPEMPAWRIDQRHVSPLIPPSQTRLPAERVAQDRAGHTVPTSAPFS